MDKSLAIVREYDPVERVGMLFNIRERVIRRCRDRHVSLAGTMFKVNDDVFLKHIVILEGFCPRREQMYLPYGGVVEDVVTKRSIIRPVAKAARDNGDDMPIRLHQFQSQRDKGGIEVYRLDSDSPHNETVIGTTVYFLVWR